jgi:site-specific recombinase XerD
VQEVADARVGWLTLQAPARVQLLGKGRKWRTCPLWESTAEELQQVIEERGPKVKEEDFVFVNRQGGRLSRSGIADVVARHAERACAETPGLKRCRITPHVIRHTTAMHLLQSGVEVNVIRSWLGHASTATTSAYVEIDLAMKRKALETCEVEATHPEPTWKAQPDILAWLEAL